MIDWLLETGLYLLGVAVVPLVGFVLVAWGLWGDRSKGRLRCPKCWYDMRGTVPRLVCPECGHDARQERQLYRTRRAWRRIVVGAVLVLLSVYPLTVVGGWYREQVVLRGFKLDQDRFDFVPWHTGPDWLVSRIPDGVARFFERRMGVLVVLDEDLAMCAKLPHLRKVEAWGSAVTDAGLRHWEELTQLEALYLVDTSVTDAGVAKLKQALPRAQVEAAWEFMAPPYPFLVD